MRYSLLLLLLLTTGCGSNTAIVERVLNDYALAASNQSNLDAYLAGAALDSAQQSKDLIAELGLTSYGASSFSQTRQLGPQEFQSCLDVSQTSFRTRSGDRIELERIERQLVEIHVVGQKVADLNLLGTPC